MYNIYATYYNCQNTLKTSNLCFFTIYCEKIKFSYFFLSKSTLKKPSNKSRKLVDTDSFFNNNAYFLIPYRSLKRQTV